MSDLGDRWTRMESAFDPDWFVRFLDQTSTRLGDHHPAVALLELDPDQRCLDVGCGVGEDARAIAELCGARVVGVDVNARMARESRSRSARHEGGPPELTLGLHRHPKRHRRVRRQVPARR